MRWSRPLLLTLLANLIFLQICPHKGTEISNPDCRDGHTKQNDVNIEITAEVIKTHIPGVKPEPSIVETCMYSVSVL